MTYDQAEGYLTTGNKQELDEFINQLHQKCKRKTYKKKATLKRKMPKEDDSEIQFIKRSKMDKQSRLKMQRPHFKLDLEDVGISKSAMLTDKHIQMAQELLHQQFPHIEGLLLPTIGTAQQFPVMRQEFIQVLQVVVFTGCVSAIETLRNRTAREGGRQICWHDKCDAIFVM